MEIELSKCCDLMTEYPPLYLPSDPVEKVAQLLSDANNGPAVIIESEQTRKLAGIVTDRDLALKVVALGRDPEFTKVEDVMTRMVNTVRADDHVQRAHDIMTELQILRIPVVDHSDRIVGILAQADIALRLNQPSQTPIKVKGMLQAQNSNLGIEER
jgi:CBS domain-containing protein